MSQIKLLSLPAVMAITSLSRSSVYQITDFPKPIKISISDSKCAGVRWIESEIQAWMQSRIQARGV